MSSSQSPRPSHLFTLRVWREELGQGEFEWRACIQHVLSGEARYIRSWDEIELFLENLDEMENVGCFERARQPGCSTFKTPHPASF